MNIYIEASKMHISPKMSWLNAKGHIYSFLHAVIDSLGFYAVYIEGHGYKYRSQSASSSVITIIL